MSMNLRKAKPAEVAITMLKDLPPLAVDKTTGTLFYYEDNYYQEFTKDGLNRTIYKYYLDNGCSDAWNESKAKNISAAIRMDPKKTPLVDFDTSEELINLRNGVLDLEEIRLKKHDPKYYFTYKLEVDYKPGEIDCPNFMEFLETVFNEFDSDGKLQPDYETIDSILKIGGYLIYPKNKMEKFFMFLGDGSNGKSFLIDIFQSFFPKKFITSLSLRLLATEDSFSRNQLLSSKLNISGEEKDSRVDAEQIKRIVSGQDITIYRKFEANISIIPKTKIVVDSNGMPSFKDSTHGTLRRIHKVAFKNRFLPYSEYKNIKNPEEHRMFPQREKTAFFKKVMEEQPAILNMFLSGLVDLREKNWSLPKTKNSDELDMEYREQTDTIGNWLMDNYELEEEEDDSFWEGIPIGEIIENFQDYYSENFPGTKFSYSSKGVGRRIREIFRVDPVRKNINKANGKRTTTTVYKLREIKQDEERGIEETLRGF